MQQLHFVCRALSVRDFIEAKPLLSVYSYNDYFKSIWTYYFTLRVYTWIIVLLGSVLNLCQSKDDKSNQIFHTGTISPFTIAVPQILTLFEKKKKEEVSNSTLNLAFYIKSGNTSFLVALCGRQWCGGKGGVTHDTTAAAEAAAAAVSCPDAPPSKDKLTAGGSCSSTCSAVQSSRTRLSTFPLPSPSVLTTGPVQPALF